jgi:uncharacterized protein (DUF934 family)
MPKLIKLTPQGAAWAEDPFVMVSDDEEAPSQGDVIVGLQRFLAEGDALIQDRRVGVLVQAGEAVEDLAYDLAKVAVVALVFPKYRDGRAYSSARVLRERLRFTGELRAVGDVLREQAQHMARCGFDAFEPADGSDPQAWGRAIHRYRHVYQRASDDRTPAYAERAAAAQSEKG